LNEGDLVTDVYTSSRRVFASGCLNNHPSFSGRIPSNGYMDKKIIWKYKKRGKPVQINEQVSFSSIIIVENVV
jgi:hypothetical protein